MYNIEVKVITDYPHTDLYTIVQLSCLTFRIAHTLVHYRKFCMVPLVFHALTLYIVLHITCLFILTPLLFFINEHYYQENYAHN